jgi:hypothetical protein
MSQALQVSEWLLFYAKCFMVKTNCIRLDDVVHFVLEKHAAC